MHVWKIKNMIMPSRVFKKAIEIDPEYWLPYRNMGQAYLKAGNYRNAIDSLTQAIELNREDGLSYFYRACAKIEQENTNKTKHDSKER